MHPVDALSRPGRLSLACARINVFGLPGFEGLKSKAVMMFMATT